MKNKKPFSPKLAALFSVLFAASTVACGGGGSAASNDEQAGGAGGTSGGLGDYTNPCDSLPKETISVNKSFWQAGFRVDLKDGELQRPTADCRGRLDIKALFYNRGEDKGYFNSRTLLTAGGLDVALDGTEVRLTQSERDAEGKFRFLLPQGFDFNASSLLSGHSGKHIAVIPIGKDSPDEHLSLEPVFQEVDSFEAGTLTCETTNLRIEADDVDRGSDLRDDIFDLHWDFALTFAGGVSWINVETNDFELTLPNGSKLAPYRGGVAMLDQANEIANFNLEFLIPRPAAGTYTLTGTGNWANTDGSRSETSGEVSFTLDDLSTLGD